MPNLAPNMFLPPDVQLSQINLQRQQALADALRQQAMENSPSEVVSGRVVPRGIGYGLTKLAQGYMAGKMQDSINEGQAKMAKDYAAYLKQGADAAFPGANPMPQGPTGTAADGQVVPTYTPSGTSTPIGDAGGMSVPVTPNRPTQPSSAGPQLPVGLREAYTAMVLRGNTEGANRLLEMAWKSQMPTEANLTLQGQGIDPRQMGPLTLAEARKKGIIEFQPGTTALDLSTGQERFQPKVGEGISLNGGVASPIPGYAGAAANIAGATKAAQENATIFHGPVNGMDNVPYRGSDVPPLTGAVPNMPGAPGFKGDPNKIALQILNDPKIPAEDKVRALAQLHAQQSAPVFGQDQAAQTYANAQAKTAAENAASLNEAAASIPQLRKTVDQLKDMSGKMTYTLAGQARDWVARQAGVATPGAVAREQYVQTVRDVLFPQLRQTFGAQFTVKEGEALIATLGDANKTPEERNAALDSFIDQKMQHLETLQRQAGVRPNQPASAPVHATPSGVRKFNPATGKIE